MTIARQPTCDCPHAREGNQCKHVVYVLARVLRARFEYVYQLALLGAELREIFEKAPPLLGDADGDGGGGGDDGRDGGGKRKPVEGDCPICFGEMGAADKGEPVVWCRAVCGQNVHKGCFETWAATKRRQVWGGGGGGEVTCPYCRSVWEGDEDMVKAIQKGGERNAEGYVNVADQLGVSTQRGEFSTMVWLWDTLTCLVRLQHVLEMVVWPPFRVPPPVLLRRPEAARMFYDMCFLAIISLEWVVIMVKPDWRFWIPSS